MMTAFWLLAVVMVGTALAVILLPMFRKPSVAITSDELNATLYRQRLKELEIEQKNGVIGDDQYQQAVHELERDLLQDVPVKSGNARIEKDIKPNMTVIVAAGLGFLLVATGLYALLGDVYYLSPTIKAEHLQRQQRATLIGSIDKVQGAMLIGGIDKVQAHLKANPRDAQAWAILGRTYLLLGHYKQSISSYEQAYQLTGGQHPQLLVDYAEALARANGGNLSGRPTELATRALSMDGNNQSALWLLGFAGYQQKQYRQVLVYWRKLYRLQQQSGKIDPMLQNYLGQVLQLTGKSLSSESALTVRVSLSSALRRQTRDTDTVFIYARAVKGPRMPLAIVRKQVSDLPLTVTLNDSMAMRPGMGLSNFRRVTIEARISRTGNAIRQKGDLYGRSNPVRVDRRQPVTIVISNRVK